MKRVLVAGVVLLGAAWALTPVPSPPLYDGAVGPAEAYLYLQPPPGYHQTGQPGSASRGFPVSQGSSGAGFVNTDETPPQAQVLAADGTFSYPAGAKSITITVTPVAPPLPVPASLGRLAGNVYHVTAAADVPGPITVSSAHPITVVLRGPAGTGNAPIARLAEGSSTWTRVTTVPLGSAPDMVVTNTDQLGYFAITSTGSSSSSGSSTSTSTGTGSGSGGDGGSGRFPVWVIVLAAVVVAGAVGALLLTTSRGSGGRPPARRR
jgi:hypothetical protein